MSKEYVKDNNENWTVNENDAETNNIENNTSEAIAILESIIASIKNAPNDISKCKINISTIDTRGTKMKLRRKIK